MHWKVQGILPNLHWLYWFLFIYHTEVAGLIPRFVKISPWFLFFKNFMPSFFPHGSPRTFLFSVSAVFVHPSSKNDQKLFEHLIFLAANMFPRSRKHSLPIAGKYTQTHEQNYQKLALFQSIWLKSIFTIRSTPSKKYFLVRSMSSQKIHVMNSICC